jgi:hypothetical protein
VDLSRTALYELLRRDAAGTLSPAHRHEIDEIALANLYAPVTGPAQIYLNEELAKRLSDGKLTAQEEATIFNRAITLSVTTPPVNAQWDPVPFQFTGKTCLPSGSQEHFTAYLSYPSLRIDGAPVSWSADWSQRAFDSIGDWTRTPLKRSIRFTKLGEHRVDLDVEIDIRNSSAERIHDERRSFSVTFRQIKPPLAVKLARLINDPDHEAGHYLPLSWLQMRILRGQIPVAELALKELIRREQLGELPSAEHDALVEHLLTIQADPSRPWSGQFGNYIESLHRSSTLSDANWQRYGRHQIAYFLRARTVVVQGQPLPIEIVQRARRGNSQDGPFSACQWKLDRFVYDGVPQSLKLTTQTERFSAVFSVGA